MEPKRILSSMNRLQLLSLSLLLLTGCLPDPNGNQSEDIFKDIKIVYPDSYPDTNRVDEYHGVKVKDPYRWLEQESAQSQQWIAQEQ